MAFEGRLTSAPAPRLQGSRRARHYVRRSPPCLREAGLELLLVGSIAWHPDPLSKLPSEMCRLSWERPETTTGRRRDSRRDFGGEKTRRRSRRRKPHFSGFGWTISDDAACRLAVPKTQKALENQGFLAERGRFELPLPLRADRFSKPAHSTTLPPLQVQQEH